MKNNNWQRALDKFCTLAKRNNLDYYLIGSVTAAVRGIDIEPRDIDLIVDIDDLKKIQRAFREYIKIPFTINGEKEPILHFGVIEIENFKFEISAFPKNNYGRHRIETICWSGHLIKTQSLELLEKVYLKNEKNKRAQKIRDYLESELLEI